MYRMIVQSIDGFRRRKATERINDSSFYNYFLIPFSAGIIGFTSFLFIVMILEYFAYLTGIYNSSKLGITEVMIATLGFVLQFIYKLVHK